MAEIISSELKSDLEHAYKKVGDTLNLLDGKDFSKEREEIRELMDLIKLRLEDVCGILQIDIFSCDYLITKYKTLHVT